MSKHPGCLLAAALLSFASVAGVAVFTYDPPVVRDHGLSAVPPPLRADKNAFPLLLNATNLWVKSPLWVGIWDREGTNWDAAGAEGLVASNAALYARLDQALTREGYRSPVMRSLTDWSPWLSPFRDMGRLMKVKSEWHLRRGEREEAAETAVKLARLGAFIREGNGSLIEYLVGISIETMGLDQILLVGMALDSSRALLELAQRLGPNTGGPAGLDSAMKGEYRVTADAIDRLVRGDFTLLEMAQQWERPEPSSLPGRWMPAWLRSGAIRMVLHPNRTKQRFADFYAEILEGRKKPLKDAFGPVVKEMTGERNGRWPRLMRRNPVGLILACLMLPAIDKVREKAAQLECKTGGVRLALAMRAYALERKTYPDKLEPLVPEFLKALPRDPFDGAPSFRYLPARRLIYAVGPDFTDDGGVEGKDIGWLLPEL